MSGAKERESEKDKYCFLHVFSAKLQNLYIYSMAVQLNEIIPNPSNPRHIAPEALEKLKKSIKEFPKMMKLRPIIVDSNNVILAGNMRYKALLELGYKQVPDEYVRKADELTEDEKRRFIIADNVGFGQWDFEVLAVDWDSGELSDWGLEIPDFMEEPSYEDLIGKEKNKPAIMKITFKDVDQLQAAESDIQELIDRKYEGAFYSLSEGGI